MSKDVKLEILYYKVNTDVSLEFGLHSDYPMRKLSSNSNNMSDLLHGLKHAISRSEIIIIVGDLSGKERLAYYIAKFIGRGTEESDNGDYGILAPGSVELPAGAIPLITNGKYGGFIIESGPQTIFALNNDRATRLRIVEETIVDYIAEHHKTYGGKPAFIRSDDTAESGSNVPMQSSDTAEQGSDIPMQSDNMAESGSDALTVVDNMSLGNVPIEEDSTKSSEFIVAEPSETTDIASSSTDIGEFDNAEDVDADADISEDHIGNDIAGSETADNAGSTKRLEDIPPITAAPQEENEDVIFYSPIIDLEDETKPAKPQKHTSKTHSQSRLIRILCIILSVLVVLGAAAFALFDVESLFPSADSYYSSLAKKYHSLSHDPSAAFSAVQKTDPGFFTWLQFNTANVDHPVLTVKSIDKSLKYLNSLPNGKAHSNGSLFSTTSVSPNLSESNTIIYGSAETGGIFEKIADIKTGPETYSGCIILTSDSRYQAQWSVFSVFSSDSIDGFDYTDTSKFGSYLEYLNEIKRISLFKNEKEFFGNETLLFLVGIKGNDSYIIVTALDSVRVLSEYVPVIGDTVSDTSSDTDSNSGDLTSSATVSGDNSPETNEPENDDFHGDSPDIIITPPEHNNSSSRPTSSVNSSVSVSSDSTPSNGSHVTSSPASSGGHSSAVSSSVVSSSASSAASSGNTSSAASSAVSSASVSSTISSASSSTTSSQKPQLDPMYTWDKEFTISYNGVKYTASAVDMVAMIIEIEMSPTIDPPEALIAQAIVKYNWLLHNNGGTNALDPNPTPQAIKYANAAKGSIIMYGKTVAKTYCYAYSAGHTANYQDIWGGTAYPYLQSVDCPVDEELKDFKTTTTYSADELSKIIKKVCGIDVSSMDKLKWLVPTQYDQNNLYCTKIKIGGKEYNGTYLRNNLLTKANTNKSTIRSSAYTIEYNKANDNFTVTCKGYGHGVGLSQRGAKAYAKQGWTHEQIISHFFPGTTLVKN